MQGVPALRVPVLADPPPLQNEMVDAAGREAPAHDETGLAAADNDDIGISHDVVLSKLR